MNENLLTKTAAFAMEMTLRYIAAGDFVVDATCGNGHDTLALAKAVGAEGKVLAVDIQEQAICASRRLLEDEGIDNTVFCQGNFLFLKDFAKETFGHEKPKAVVFNLGYLPGGDKSITTRTEDVLSAMEAALDLIQPGGIVTAVLYPGHPEGRKERQALLAMAENLPADRYHTVYASMPNQKKNPPEVLWITKKK